MGKIINFTPKVPRSTQVLWEASLRFDALISDLVSTNAEMELHELLYVIGSRLGTLAAKTADPALMVELLREVIGKDMSKELERDGPA